MAEACFSMVRGRVLRLTRVNDCGEPVPGAQSVVVSKGFISIGFTAVTDTGTEVTVVNADGDTWVKDTPDPRFQAYTVEIQFCGVDSAAFELVTGQDPVADEDGNAIGFGMDTGDLERRFALEVWSNIADDGCVAGAQRYGYILLPYLKGGSIGDLTVGNDAINFTVSGAQTQDGNAWGVGPYDITKDNTGAPTPLFDAISDTLHLHVQVVTLPPPTDACGYLTLGTGLRVHALGGGLYSISGHTVVPVGGGIVAIGGPGVTNYSSGVKTITGSD